MEGNKKERIGWFHTEVFGILAIFLPVLLVIGFILLVPYLGLKTTNAFLLALLIVLTLGWLNFYVPEIRKLVKAVKKWRGHK